MGRPGNAVAAEVELRVLPESSAPINCSQQATLAFRYTPGDSTPSLRGFEIVVDCSHPLTFSSDDIHDSGLLAPLGEYYFDIVDIGDGTISVSAALLGATSGLNSSGDLFSVDFHGNHDGLGEAQIIHYKLRDLDNGDIFADLFAATVPVDCLPPEVPGLQPEPPFTQGTTNTLDWSDESSSGATEYLVQGAEDAAFGVGLFDSGWVTGLAHEFAGLADGQIHHYRVRSRDALSNLSDWSTSESSTQDDTSPVSAAEPQPPYRNVTPFDVPFTASDATSGVAVVELWVDVDGGGYTLQASSASSPISFTPAGDGLHSFHTVGVDGAGNHEDPPVTPDTFTIVDLTAPSGSFEIDNGLPYTPDLVVSLDSDIADANSPLAMRFSNDFSTWSGWLPYSMTHAWNLAPGGDGVRTVYAEFRDQAMNVLALEDHIVYDTTFPEAVSDITAMPGHEEVTVTWTDPPSADIAFLEIYRGLWHDGAGSSTYPEYDDLAGNTIPTRPADRLAAQASPEWVLAGNAAPGDESFVDSWAPRGVYHYEVFAADGAYNFSGTAAAGDRSTNYWLGDIRDSGGGDGDFDGLVNAMDVTELGAAFGTWDGHAHYYATVDVGPTDDDSRLGVPLTDDVIDFEDLMIFAMNYGVVSPLAATRGEEGPPSFTWRRIDATTWSLGLSAPCADLMGLRLRAALPEGTDFSISPGEALERQDPYFLGQTRDGNLDVCFALLGTGRALCGFGELLRVSLPTTSPPSIQLEARSADNTTLAFSLTAGSQPDLPGSYRLGQNHPNPFNPETHINFDLPHAQGVFVEVFDAGGRRVAVLVDEALDAGFHTVSWDGRDANGEPVASGVYFYRVKAGPLTETRKMLLLK